ncbi:FAD:protein FMN transferase [Roseibacillus persicicus]|uniref:FAD:protein FMN transferase n=1 Tax=Roseibacillus persicicus TaxID=454148 RepID=A0A918TRP0_9BACT|nr:FAD:protein FMN transferase [Roseibacillus persicicus]GHC53774.1 FAD:protein FMN transferase [Roseibacillus persicicus]
MPTPIRPKKKKAKIFLFLLLLIIAGGAAFQYYRSKNPEKFIEEERVVVLERFQAERPLMGTLFSITVYAETAEKAQSAMTEAFTRAATINQVASDYLPDSELTRFNGTAAEEWFVASDDFLTMVAYGLELADLTNGAYDPTLGTLTHLWRRTKEAGQLPSTPTLDEARAMAGWEKVEADLKENRIRKTVDGLRLDLGGLAKGYAVDAMLEVFRARGLPHALVVAGGDVRCGLAPPNKEGWTVGLKDYNNELNEVMTLEDCAVSTSGDVQQFVEIDGRRYSHIVDPSTGLGVTDSLMATVVAKNGLMSDPLATAACIDPRFFTELSAATDIHSRILSKDQQQISPKFPSVVPLNTQKPESE